MKKFIYRYIEDMLIASGAVLITAATFLLSEIAAMYVAGAFLLALGAYLSKHPPDENKRR